MITHSRQFNYRRLLSLKNCIAGKLKSFIKGNCAEKERHGGRQQQR